MMMQVFQDVPTPPTIANPPANWQSATVPSGSWFKFYAYEEFADIRDFFTGLVTGRKLVWKRAAFFLPAQTFNIMELQEDNTWECAGTVIGPRGYFDLDADDGTAMVQRLQAA